MWPATIFNDDATEFVLCQFVADGTVREHEGAVSGADVAGFCGGLSEVDKAWLKGSLPDPALALCAPRSLVLLLRLHAVARAALQSDGQREEVDAAAIAELRQAVELNRTALARVKGAESERLQQQLATAWQRIENMSAVLTRRLSTTARAAPAGDAREAARITPHSPAKGRSKAEPFPAARQGATARPRARQGGSGRKVALVVVLVGLVVAAWFTNRPKPAIVDLQPSEFQSVPGIARLSRYDKRAIVYMAEGWSPEDAQYAALRRGLEGLGFREYSIFNAAGRLLSTPTGELAPEFTAAGRAAP
jgi:hypothetical protein